MRAYTFIGDLAILNYLFSILTFLGESKPELNLVPSHSNNPEAYYTYLETIAFISTEIHKGYGPLWNPSLSPEVAESYKERLIKRYEIIEEMLKKNDFILSDSFSVADAYLYTVTRWASKLNIDLSGFPALTAYIERVNAIPAVQKSLSEEGLS